MGPHKNNCQLTDVWMGLKLFLTLVLHALGCFNEDCKNLNCVGMKKKLRRARACLSRINCLNEFCVMVRSMHAHFMDCVTLQHPKPLIPFRKQVRDIRRSLVRQDCAYCKLTDCLKTRHTIQHCASCTLRRFYSFSECNFFNVITTFYYHVHDEFADVDPSRSVADDAEEENSGENVELEEQDGNEEDNRVASTASQSEDITGSEQHADTATPGSSRNENVTEDKEGRRPSSSQQEDIARPGDNQPEDILTFHFQVVNIWTIEITNITLIGDKLHLRLLCIAKLHEYIVTPGGNQRHNIVKSIVHEQAELQFAATAAEPILGDRNNLIINMNIKYCRILHGTSEIHSTSRSDDNQYIRVVHIQALTTLDENIPAYSLGNIQYISSSGIERLYRSTKLNCGDRSDLIVKGNCVKTRLVIDEDTTLVELSNVRSVSNQPAEFLDNIRSDHFKYQLIRICQTNLGKPNLSILWPSTRDNQDTIIATTFRSDDILYDWCRDTPSRHMIVSGKRCWAKHRLVIIKDATQVKSNIFDNDSITSGSTQHEDITVTFHFQIVHITRTEITNITQSGGTLYLHLLCDANLDGYIITSGGNIVRSSGNESARLECTAPFICLITTYFIKSVDNEQNIKRMFELNLYIQRLTIKENTSNEDITRSDDNQYIRVFHIRALRTFCEDITDIKTQIYRTDNGIFDKSLIDETGSDRIRLKTIDCTLIELNSDEGDNQQHEMYKGFSETFYLFEYINRQPEIISKMIPADVVWGFPRENIAIPHSSQHIARSGSNQPEDILTFHFQSVLITRIKITSITVIGDKLRLKLLCDANLWGRIIISGGNQREDYVKSNARLECTATAVEPTPEDRNNFIINMYIHKCKIIESGHEDITRSVDNQYIRVVYIIRFTTFDEDIESDGERITSFAIQTPVYKSSLLHSSTSGSNQHEATTSSGSNLNVENRSVKMRLAIDENALLVEFSSEEEEGEGIVYVPDLTVNEYCFELRELRIKEIFREEFISYHYFLSQKVITLGGNQHEGIARSGSNQHEDITRPGDNQPEGITLTFHVQIVNITRTKITNITQSGGTVYLHLSCDANLDGYIITSTGNIVRSSDNESARLECIASIASRLPNYAFHNKNLLHLFYQLHIYIESCTIKKESTSNEEISRLDDNQYIRVVHIRGLRTHYENIITLSNIGDSCDIPAYSIKKLVFKTCNNMSMDTDNNDKINLMFLQNVTLVELNSDEDPIESGNNENRLRINDVFIDLIQHEQFPNIYPSIIYWKFITFHLQIIHITHIKITYITLIGDKLHLCLLCDANLCGYIVTSDGNQREYIVRSSGNESARLKCTATAAGPTPGDRNNLIINMYIKYCQILNDTSEIHSTSRSDDNQYIRVVHIKALTTLDEDIPAFSLGKVQYINLRRMRDAVYRSSVLHSSTSRSNQHEATTSSDSNLNVESNSVKTRLVIDEDFTLVELSNVRSVSNQPAEFIYNIKSDRFQYMLARVCQTNLGKPNLSMLLPWTTDNQDTIIATAFRSYDILYDWCRDNASSNIIVSGANQHEDIARSDGNQHEDIARSDGNQHEDITVTFYFQIVNITRTKITNITKSGGHIYLHLLCDANLDGYIITSGGNIVRSSGNESARLECTAPFIRLITTYYIKSVDNEQNIKRMFELNLYIQRLTIKENTSNEDITRSDDNQYIRVFNIRALRTFCEDITVSDEGHSVRILSSDIKTPIYRTDNGIIDKSLIDETGSDRIRLKTIDCTLIELNSDEGGNQQHEMYEGFSETCYLFECINRQPEIISEMIPANVVWGFPRENTLTFHLQIVHITHIKITCITLIGDKLHLHLLCDANLYEYIVTSGGNQREDIVRSSGNESARLKCIATAAEPTQRDRNNLTINMYIKYCRILNGTSDEDITGSDSISRSDDNLTASDGTSQSDDNQSILIAHIKALTTLDEDIIAYSLGDIQYMLLSDITTVVYRTSGSNQHEATTSSGSNLNVESSSVKIRLVIVEDFILIESSSDEDFVKSDSKQHDEFDGITVNERSLLELINVRDEIILRNPNISRSEEIWVWLHHDIAMSHTHFTFHFQIVNITRTEITNITRSDGTVNLHLLCDANLDGYIITSGGNIVRSSDNESARLECIARASKPIRESRNNFITHTYIQHCNILNGTSDENLTASDSTSRSDDNQHIRVIHIKALTTLDEDIPAYSLGNIQYISSSAIKTVYRSSVLGSSTSGSNQHEATTSSGSNLNVESSSVKNRLVIIEDITLIESNSDEDRITSGSNQHEDIARSGGNQSEASNTTDNPRLSSNEERLEVDEDVTMIDLTLSSSDEENLNIASNSEVGENEEITMDDNDDHTKPADEQNKETTSGAMESEDR